MLYEFKDSDGNSLGIFNIGDNVPEHYIGEFVKDVAIASLEKYVEPRVERDEIFAQTLDRMNPLWYNSLTDDQRAELSTWRQAWLDYPETGVRPTDLSWLS